MSTEYKVRWEVDVTAENPLEAAAEAKRIQLYPASHANVFGVKNKDDPHEVPVSIELSPEEVSKHCMPKKVKKKPFSVCVTVNVYYDIDRDTLPTWANEAGVESLFASANEDYNKPTRTLKDLGADGIWLMDPVDIEIDKIMAV